MKHYIFLFKPLFYIISVLFASWLVVFIDNLKPEPKITSDKYRYQLQADSAKVRVKQVLRDYNKGRIDSLDAYREIDTYLDLYSNKKP